MVPFWVPNIVRNLKFRDHNFDNHPHDVRHACLTRGLFNIRTCESSHIVREHDQPRTEGIESQVSDPVESSDSCTETEGFPRRNRYKKEWFRLQGADRLTVSGKLSDQHHRQARRLSHALVDPRKPRPPWPLKLRSCNSTNTQPCQEEVHSAAKCNTGLKVSGVPQTTTTLAKTMRHGVARECWC